MTAKQLVIIIIFFFNNAFQGPFRRINNLFCPLDYNCIYT